MTCPPDAFKIRLKQCQLFPLPPKGRNACRIAAAGKAKDLLRRSLAEQDFERRRFNVLRGPALKDNDEKFCGVYSVLPVFSAYVFVVFHRKQFRADGLFPDYVLSENNKD